MLQQQSIPTDPAKAQRLRITVRGRVQGVGFRPFVHGLAGAHGLNGWVRNDCEGVVLEVEGADCGAFVNDLRSRAPDLARIETIAVDAVCLHGDTSFEILKSKAHRANATMIGPDVATCDACLQELFDPAERRYRYPFINCTHCGPRFTITRALPYDRPNTSMSEFAMCAACGGEYTDPADRRFHAQPVACPRCGPRLEQPIEQILEWLTAGRIVAIKGLGGYHLACDASNEQAVTRLRQRKHREAKPFAIMIASIAAARRFANVDEVGERLLADRTRPIVLFEQKGETPLVRAVATDLTSVGIMLPYTPLHYLLFHEAAGRPAGLEWLHHDAPDLALVMTSANRRDEPLITDNQTARDQLAGIADAVVGHDRPILVRADDSVVQADGSTPTVIRRGRGITPDPVPLGRSVRPIIAVGGHLKTTVCVTREDEAFVSQHLGDLDSAATRRFFLEAIDHLLSVLDVKPELAVHDMHPDFFSTRHAQGLRLPTLAVQHHHAHIATVAAEHRRTDAMLGLALDGTGYGPDGSIWGGELLLLDGAGYERLGHLRQLPQPGNDVAAREPWRMAASALSALGLTSEIEARFASFPAAPAVRGLLQSSVPVVRTSSLGRWFDAAAGLLGVVPVADYEGHAAMVLESLVRRPFAIDGAWDCEPDGTLNLLPLLERILDLDARSGAEAWHGTLVAALADWSLTARERTGIRTIALGGGCILNRVLRGGLVSALEAKGLEVLLPLSMPPNDGGLSLGQAWIGAQTTEEI